MSQTNNLNHNLNMILVLKFDDIKKGYQKHSEYEEIQRTRINFCA